MSIEGNSEQGSPDPSEVLAANIFGDLFSSPDEDKESSETQPEATQQDVEPEPDEAEASTEQADAEGESDDPEQRDDEQDATPNDDLIPVVINGVEVRVTREELAKGYSRQADYTQKTQKLAEERKAIEAKEAALAARDEQTAQQLAQLEAALKEATPQEPNWSELQKTAEPGDFAATWAMWEQHKQRMAQLAEQRKAAEAKVTEARVAEHQKYIQSEQEKLFEAIPSWKDEKTRKAEGQKLVAFAEKIGFTRDEVAQTVDHRALMLLRDAMLYRESLEKRPVVEAKIERVRVATPGPTGQKQKPLSAEQAARKRLEKTGSVADAAVALQSFFTD